jgi:molybdopterin-guanine dinucleotide biosynthesis adapter protein
MKRACRSSGPIEWAGDEWAGWSARMRVMGIVGWKNSGKTTLVVRLIEHLAARGLRVSSVKHAHHRVELDRPGKDSHRHRMAGAREVMLATCERFALFHELQGAPEPELPELLARMSPVDLVLVEGFKRFPHAKIEVRREGIDRPLLAATDPDIVAIAADHAIEAHLPVLPLDDVVAIADFIVENARPVPRGSA